jgi:phosphatidyl-myo-inositol dimannoside synthase
MPPNSMNIVISQDFFPKIGGAHSWIYEVYRRWPSEVEVLTTGYSSNTREALQQYEFDAMKHGALRIHRESDPFGSINVLDLRCLSRLQKEVRRVRRLAGGGITFLNCLRAFPEGIVGVVFRKMRRCRSRLITYAHGEEILIARTSRQLEWMTKLVYSWSDLVIANSESTVKLVKGICPRAEVVCILPGVDAAAFRAAAVNAAGYKSRLGIPPESVIVSTVGRMEPRKNHAMVIRVIGELRRKGLSVNYLCCGDGQERENLVALTQEQNLEKWVHFRGAVTEQEKMVVYGASDIYVMPSIQVGEMIEGFGLVFLEAAAAGIPAICGKSGGQSEAVIDGETGLVVDGSRFDEVKNAIEVLVKDKALREKMGQRGIEWAREQDWARVAERTHSAINHLTE